MRELAPGQDVVIGDRVRIVATHADHHGRREPFGPTADCVGHLVDTPDGAAYLAGDTGLFDGMAELKDLTTTGAIELAAIPVWGWGPNLGPGHLDPHQAARAAELCGVRRAVPVHWGTLHPAFLARMMHHQLTTPGERFTTALDAAVGTGVAHLLPLGGHLRL